VIQIRNLPQKIFCPKYPIPVTVNSKPELKYFWKPKSPTLSSSITLIKSILCIHQFFNKIQSIHLTKTVLETLSIHPTGTALNNPSFIIMPIIPKHSTPNPTLLNLLSNNLPKVKNSKINHHFPLNAND
jgi:hypothetical protein